MENETLRIGTKVKILSCSKKSFIGKEGTLSEKRESDFFPNTKEYNIYIPEKDTLIWVFSSQVKKIEKVKNKKEKYFYCIYCWKTYKENELLLNKCCPNCKEYKGIRKISKKKYELIEK